MSLLKAGCNTPIMKKLEKLGAIKLLKTGKLGAHSSRAALYMREA